MPAIERYTGVLYDALGAADLDSLMCPPGSGLGTIWRDRRQ